MTDENPTLTLGGRDYEGWTKVSVVRDIERMAGAFRLELTDKWPGNEQLRQVKPGQACILKSGGDTLVSGWVDAIEATIDSGDHTIAATGRDKTGDLVDCTAVHAGGEWLNRSLASIAEDLAGPFGVSVIAHADGAGDAVDRFKLDEGETVFAAIERLCRIAGVLPTSRPTGELLLTTAAQASTVDAMLKTGKGGNVLSATAAFNAAERFSKYTVKGQNNGFGLSDAGDAAGPNGSATDPAITRYRPLTVIAEETVDADLCAARAQWEAAVRSGRARRLTATVQGWYHRGGLWQPLTLIGCDIPEVNLSGLMLASAVTYAKDDTNGTTAEITLVDPAAFKALAVQPKESTWGW